MNAQPSTATTGRLEELVVELVKDCGGLVPGELVCHFDLVVATRRIDDTGREHLGRHHWATVGSDPHLSYGIMNAQAIETLRQIT